MIRIGVLALQGDFREHINILHRCNVEAIPVKLPEDLQSIDGLIIPGGESTTIGKLMQRHDLDNAIMKKYENGVPIYGTCAGAILLSKDIVGSSQPRLKLLEISIKRNDYGRQINSFETELDISSIGKFKGIFIRAPVISKIRNGIRVLSELNGNPVFIEKSNILASTFHPELTNDKRIHEYFLDIVKKTL